MTITGVHPYADKFPMLPEPELAELAESIRANGLRNPIVLTPDGLILDGRNRAAACERVGVDPDTTVYEGGDLAEYVIDCNTSRRHMTTGARAMATALVLAADGRRRNGRWQYGHLDSKDLGKSVAELVRQAGIILDHIPDLAESVVTGDVALDAAHRRACEARDAERTESGCAMTALRPPRRGACRAVSFTSASASLAPTVGNGRRRSTTERRHKAEPNFYRRRNNDDRHADC